MKNIIGNLFNCDDELFFASCESNDGMCNDDGEIDELPCEHVQVNGFETYINDVYVDELWLMKVNDIIMKIIILYNWR